MPAETPFKQPKWTTLPVTLDDPNAAHDFTPKGELTPNHNEYIVLEHRAGHMRIIWDRTVKATVDAARATFDSLQKQGYAAFKVKNEKGEQGELVREFDPNIERMMFIPALQGG